MAKEMAIGSRYASLNAELTGSTPSGPTPATIHDKKYLVKEEVVLLPCPTESQLVHELRTMVSGKAVLNESKKAIGN